ncbi:hypothetical protein C8J98_103370 [Luteibacter sp. OK325]|uniref:HEAT repeat domain-containing protein n=1 Tax=Luteibacter sp. OK325 TaxID=2135670 RepID=UPI000D3AB0E6|nr:HEAT repeat domain-containing protein [Luteibacter sp. OK325]PTR33607.1 hypothetical protein C8J98_103370 [Luteibacter sp. OK325]
MVQLARAARAVPELRRFAELAASIIEVERPASFWELRDAFDELLKPSIWSAFHNAMLRDLADAVPLTELPEWHWHGVTVCQSPDFSLVLTSETHSDGGRPAAPSDTDTPVATTMAAPEMLAVLSPQPVLAERYGMAAGSDIEVFDPFAWLMPRGTEMLQPWLRFDVDAPREACHLEAGEQPLCLLTFAASSVVWQRWEFERGTGRPVQPVQTSNQTRAILVMLDELARARHAEAVPDVRALLDHPYFQVRWEAARCLGALDTAVAREALHLLANDRHPHVAAVAVDTLRRMNA